MKKLIVSLLAFAFLFYGCSNKVTVTAKYSKVSGNIGAYLIYGDKIQHIDDESILELRRDSYVSNNAYVLLLSTKDFVTTINPYTVFKLNNITRDGFKQTLRYGSIRNVINKISKQDSYITETPTAVVGVRGTIYEMSYDGIKSDIKVYRGMVKLNNCHGKLVDLNTGKMVTVLSNGDMILSRLVIDANGEIKDIINIRKIDMNSIMEDISTNSFQVNMVLKTELKTKSVIKKASDISIESQEKKLSDDINSQEKSIEKVKIKNQKKYIKDDGSF